MKNVKRVIRFETHGPATTGMPAMDLDQADFLIHEAESDHWSPPASGNLRVGRNDDPPLNADLHIGQSDIRPLIREQLQLLRDEIQEALNDGVDERMTRIHYQDALVRIAGTIGG